MEYKEEYLEEKRKYIEMRDRVMAQFGLMEQSGGGIISTITNALFGKTNDTETDSQEGGQGFHLDKNKAEVIFLNDKDLTGDTFKKINTLIWSGDNVTRQKFIDIKKFSERERNQYLKLDLNALYKDLANKAYVVKRNNKKGDKFESSLLTKDFYSRDKEPTFEELEKEREKKWAELQQRLQKPQQRPMTGGNDEYINALSTIDNLSIESQDKLIYHMLKNRVNDDRLTGLLNEVLSGGAVKFVQLDLQLNDDSGWTNPASFKNAIKEINSKTGLRLTTVLIRQSEYIIGLYNWELSLLG